MVTDLPVAPVLKARESMVGIVAKIQHAYALDQKRCLGIHRKLIRVLGFAFAWVLGSLGMVLGQELPTVPQVLPRPIGSPSPTPEPQGKSSAVLDLIYPLSNADAKLELFIGQARTLTLKKPIAEGKVVGVVAVGDPSIADFEILPNPRMLRLSGKRACENEGPKILLL
jgi:hypothetical protein